MRIDQIINLRVPFSCRLVHDLSGVLTLMTDLMPPCHLAWLVAGFLSLVIDWSRVGHVWEVLVLHALLLSLVVWMLVAFVLLLRHWVKAIHLVSVPRSSSLPMLPTRRMIATIRTGHHKLLRRCLSIVILIHWSGIVVGVWASIPRRLFPPRNWLLLLLLGLMLSRTTLRNLSVSGKTLLRRIRMLMVRMHVQPLAVALDGSSVDFFLWVKVQGIVWLFLTRRRMHLRSFFLVICIGFVFRSKDVFSTRIFSKLLVFIQLIWSLHLLNNGHVFTMAGLVSVFVCFTRYLKRFGAILRLIDRLCFRLLNFWPLSWFRGLVAHLGLRIPTQRRFNACWVRIKHLGLAQLLLSSTLMTWQILCLRRQLESLDLV